MRATTADQVLNVLTLGMVTALGSPTATWELGLAVVQAGWDDEGVLVLSKASPVLSMK